MLLMGLIVSWLMVVFGALQVVGACAVLYGSGNAETIAHYTRRYFGSKSIGEVIDFGFTIFFFGLVLGALVTIGRQLQLRNEELRRRKSESDRGAD